VMRSRAALAEARTGQRAPVAVVMTLGALHEGHAALLRAARERAATVIATIFVNPLQFGRGEDFDRYPRTFEADLAVCAAAGVDVVFAPPPAEMYPHGEPQVRVDPGPLGSVLEGASRPGHFAGVLTVVLKLLQLTRPDLAFFGEKDYQQLTLIRAMVRDLDVPTRIVAVPTVREPDGLARSSRNRHLSPEQRLAARAVPAALRAGADAAATPAATPEKVLAAAATAASGVDLDYLALTDGDLRPLAAPISDAARHGGATRGETPAGGAARLLIAARVGTTRLIDNTLLDLPQDPDRLTPRGHQPCCGP
jgi:pantoate--beta-alanine ligase